MAMGWRSRVQIPVGAKFSAAVQTGPGSNPASHTMGTGSSPRVNSGGHRFDHPPPSRAKVIEKVEIYIQYI